MDGAAIVAVSAAVVALVQLVKWSGLPDKWGPIAVLILALLGVAFWGYSKGTFERTVAFDYFAAWIAVAVPSVISTLPPPMSITTARPLPMSTP